MSTVSAVGYAIARFRQSPVTGIVLTAWRLRRGSCIPQSTDRGSRQFQLIAAADRRIGIPASALPTKENRP